MSDHSGIRNDLGDRLAAGIEGDAKEVLVGLNWTLVRGGAGIGFCHSPVRGTAGCSELPDPGGYAGRPLADLARYRYSANPFEQAIGFAAINAHHNRYGFGKDLGKNPARFDANALDHVPDKGEGAVAIGLFPGFRRRFPQAPIIEREPRSDCHPEEEAPALLAQARSVVITASAMANGSLARLLPLCRHAFVLCVGPSAPLAPAMFEAGIDILGGMVATDENQADSAFRIVGEGGTVQALRPHLRFITLMQPAAASAEY